jgi:hypothetical protein
MPINIKTLNDAVSDLLASLDEAQQTELPSVILNSQFEQTWRWLQMIIERFGLRGDAGELIADIDARFPDESALKLIESDSDEPIFEAKIILREAQKRLRGGR